MDLNKAQQAGVLPSSPDALPGEVVHGSAALAAKPFTPSELERIPDDVPCLFHVDAAEAGAGMMPRGVVGMLAGPPGAGKSFLALDMLLCAANGGALFGSKEGDQAPYVRTANAGRVLFLSLEDDRASVGRRLRAIFEARCRKPTTQDLERLHVVGWDDLESERILFRLNESKEIAATSLFDAATKLLATPGLPWSLVVIDTFARAARGGAEVDAEIGTEVLQQLESWTRVAGNPAVLVVHHTRKSNSNDDVRKRLAAMLDAEAVRGSSAIVGAVRWVGMLAKVITEPDDQAKGCPRRCVVFEVAKVNGLADDAMPRQYLTTAEGGVLRRMNRNERVAFESVLKPQPGNGSRLTRSQPQTPSAADFEG